MHPRLILAPMLLLAAALACSAGGPNRKSPQREARALAKKAAKAERKGEDAQAYVLFSEAAALRPNHKGYRGKMAALQGRAALQAKSSPTLMGTEGNAPENDPTPDAALDPEQIFTSLTAREFIRSRPMQAPPELLATAGRIDFDVTADARALFDNVARAFGLETVYDGDYPPDGARIRFRVTAADYREAIRALEAATGSFVIPLSPKLFMVAKDNPQKRNDLERTITLTVGVPQALTAQELTEMVAAVRQVTGVEKIAWDTAQSQLVIHDRMSRALPTMLLLDQLISYRADVSIDLEFLEVSDSDIQNYGFTVTNSFPLVYLGKLWNNPLSIPSAVTNLLTFGGGKTLFGIGVAQVQAMFNQTTGTARSLFRTTVRSADGQAATFHVGEKYPIITSGYYGSTPAAPGTATPPPSYTFEDLGIVLKVTPRVHGNGEMSLAVETTYEVLAGSAINGIPVIGNRKLSTQVRLRNDEWAIVAGMLNESKQKSTSGFWGLAQVPLLGNLFKQVSKDNEHSHVLIAIKPHLLSLPPDQVVSRTLHVGTEVRPFTPL